MVIDIAFRIVSAMLGTRFGGYRPLANGDWNMTTTAGIPKNHDF